MYNLLKQEIAFVITVGFTMSIVLIGSYFSINLMLAVAMESFILSELKDENEFKASIRKERSNVQEKLF